MGVSIQDVTQDLAKEFGAMDTTGALVADVMDDSPAAKAKLERGDIITSYNGITIREPGQLRALVAETAPGTRVTLSIFHDNKAQDVTVVISELPKELSKTSHRESGSGKGEHALAGVTVENVSSQSERFGRSKVRSGVVVTEIEADSPAERAGMRTGDIIREINRNPVRDVKDFERLTSQLTPKSSVLLLLNRGNATIFLSIIGERS
jgi:serine protease Do